MPLLSDQGRTEVESLARQTGFSADAVATMWASVVHGGGRMAQFDHPEFGGSGQWMRGGMTMITDFRDHDLKARVDALCEALARSVGREPVTPPDIGHPVPSQTAGGGARQDSRDASWYPASLGTPDSSGAQNRARYAWFAKARRLAVDDGAAVTIYDTGDHRIGGVSQQQGEHGSVTFVSQHGTVDVDRLPVVEEGQAPASRHNATDARSMAPDAGNGDPFGAIEKLADLHARGILDDVEYTTKKAELLKRI